jgi:hypothetical protein
MGLFRKKPDPISERARHLNDQIAALEAEIQKLAERKETAAPPPPVAKGESPFAAPAAPAPAAPAAPAPKRPVSHPSPQPRLRSTAVPHGHNVPASVPTPPPGPVHEPIFEEVDQGRIQSDAEPVTPAHYNDLGVRKYDMASAWQRMKNHFRGPVASNPKLVHYLSAGSIQGLRPLRYEKRVARNRFIVLAVFLVLALWGIIAIFMSRK